MNRVLQCSSEIFRCYVKKALKRDIQNVRCRIYSCSHTQSKQGILYRDSIFFFMNESFINMGRISLTYLHIEGYRNHELFNIIRKQREGESELIFFYCLVLRSCDISDDGRNDDDAREMIVT